MAQHSSAAAAFLLVVLLLLPALSSPRRSPAAAAAPVLEAVDETSMRVHFNAPPVGERALAHKGVTLFVRADDGEWEAVDGQWNARRQRDGSYVVKLAGDYDARLVGGCDVRFTEAEACEKGAAPRTASGM